jgi:hypothetical protein
MDPDTLSLAAAGNPAGNDAGVVDSGAIIEMARAFLVGERLAIPVDVVEVGLHGRPHRSAKFSA